jgi:GNAT superfamily N-acetyltransferase
MKIRIREASSCESDREVIVHHRRAMFHDMEHRGNQTLEAMSERFRVWLKDKMEVGEYRAWFAVEGDKVASGTGLWLMDWPPHVIAGGKWRGNILNVYTEPEYRKRGLARKLINEALDWCEKEGVEAVILHASDQGKSLYEQMGFERTNEMRLKKRVR